MLAHTTKLITHNGNQIIGDKKHTIESKGTDDNGAWADRTNGLPQWHISIFGHLPLGCCREVEFK